MGGGQPVSVVTLICSSDAQEDAGLPVASKTNNQASFRQSLLKNNMEVDAAMGLSRNLDETGSPTVCMLGLHQVYFNLPAIWFSCIQTWTKV